MRPHDGRSHWQPSYGDWRRNTFHNKIHRNTTNFLTLLTFQSLSETFVRRRSPIETETSRKLFVFRWIIIWNIHQPNESVSWYRGTLLGLEGRSLHDAGQQNTPGVVIHKVQLIHSYLYNMLCFPFTHTHTYSFIIINYKNTCYTTLLKNPPTRRIRYSFAVSWFVPIPTHWIPIPTLNWGTGVKGWQEAWRPSPQGTNQEPLVVTVKDMDGRPLRGRPGSALYA